MTLKLWILEQRKLAEAVTGGPWWFHGQSGNGCTADSLVGGSGLRLRKIITAQTERLEISEKEDAAFIASARTALPLALDMLEVAVEALETVDEYNGNAPRAIARLDEMVKP
jgi:hypothetical protein